MGNSEHGTSFVCTQQRDVDSYMTIVSDSHHLDQARELEFARVALVEFPSMELLLPLSLTHFFSLPIFLSHTHALCLSHSLSLSHSLTLFFTLSLSHTHTHTHSLYQARELEFAQAALADFPNVELLNLGSTLNPET